MGKILHVGVLASGSGTDLQSIIDASEEHKINAAVALVISDRSDAQALKRAERNDIPWYCIECIGRNRELHETQIDTILRKHQVDLVVGAGYLRIMTPDFVRKWKGKLINIHPALLPSFKGVNGQGDALAYGVKITGCTTHFMDEEMDHGPIILQAAMKVQPDDTRNTLAARILQVEHQILPRTIDLYAQDRLVLEGRSVRILPGDSWITKYDCYPEVLYSDGY
jgi:phosphoribosylglycinamide formyltransferase-1